MSLRHLIAVLVMLGSAPAGLAAQALSLADAMRLAGRDAYANRIAAADARAAEGNAGLALRGVLPTARLEGGYVRTTDPLGAFGATLRQRGVTPSAFDPARLNDPAAIGNLTSALVVEQP